LQDSDWRRSVPHPLAGKWEELGEALKSKGLLDIHQGDGYSGSHFELGFSWKLPSGMRLMVEVHPDGGYEVFTFREFRSRVRCTSLDQALAAIEVRMGSAAA
jgi:hypothetical protein